MNHSFIYETNKATERCGEISARRATDLLQISAFWGNDNHANKGSLARPSDGKKAH